MKKTLQSGFLFVGAIALSLTFVSANCGTGKCASSKKVPSAKCNSDIPTDGKCGNTSKTEKYDNDKNTTQGKK